MLKSYQAGISSIRWLTPPRDDVSPVLQYGLRPINGGALDWFDVAVSPAPAASKGVPAMDDAIAAGDGTLHGAIDYWRNRALAAEAARDVDETNKVLADNYIELTAASKGAEAQKSKEQWLAETAETLERLSE